MDILLYKGCGVAGISFFIRPSNHLLVVTKKNGNTKRQLFPGLLQSLTMTDERSEQSQFQLLWQEFLTDIEATATEYEEDGWVVHTVTPGDVTPLYDTEKPFGLSVLIPNPEFDQLHTVVSDSTFENVDVYKNTVSSTVFVLVVERDPVSETAVFIPVYYNFVTDSEFLSAAEEYGKMPIRFRALGVDDQLTFVHDDPSLFAPDRSDEEDG